MRKKAILFGLLLVLLKCAWAQTVTFKKVEIDGSGNTGLSVLEEDSSYIVIAVGNDGPPATMVQLKMFKFDKLGNLLFSKKYGATGQLFGAGASGSVCRTYDGNFALGGSIEYSGVSDAVLVKFDADLDTLWTKRYGGNAYDIFYQCLETPDSGFVMVGATNSFGNDGQIYLVKTDSIGDFEWQRTLGTQYRDIGRSIVLRSDPTGYIVSGDKHNSNDIEDRVVYWVTLDSIGQKVSDTTIGVSGYNGATFMSRLTDSTSLIFGYLDTLSNDGFYPYCAKIDRYGSVLWFSFVNSPNEQRDVIIQARQLSDGNILLGGGHAMPGSMLQGLWLMKIDSTGLKLWERIHSYDEDGITKLYDFDETLDKGLLITGMANFPDDSTNLYSQHVLLMKLDSLGCLEGDCGLLTDLPETQKQPVELSVFPNPAKESFTIKYALPYGLHNNPQVVLYNLQGKQVYRSLLYKAHDMLKVPTADLGSGMYIYQLVSGGKVLGSGKVLVE